MPRDLSHKDNDPLTIDAEAAAILTSATRTVAAILARREELDAAGQQSTPLGVIIGENHSMPSHYIYQMLVLDGLLAHGESIAFGIEQEHNLLSITFFEAAGEEPDSEIAAEITAKDKGNKMALQSWMGFYGSSSADHARTVLYRYLLRQPDINFKMTDAAMNQYFLEPQDETTAASMKACIGRTHDYVRADKQEGFHIRNHHMTAQISELAKKTGARIAIQQAGFMHVAGDRPCGFDGQKSLAACFNEKNIPALAILPHHQVCTPANIPATHGLKAEHIIFSENLPQKDAIYPSDDNPSPKAAFTDRKLEAEWVNAILARTNLTGEQMTETEYAGYCKTVGDSVYDRLKDWKKQYYPA